MMAGLEAKAEDGNAAASREFRRWLEVEMKLTGTTKPIPIELINPEVLGSVLNSQSSDLIALAGKGDPAAVSKLLELLVKAARPA